MVLLIYLALILLSILHLVVDYIVKNELERRCSCNYPQEVTNLKKVVRGFEATGNILTIIIALFSVFVLIYGIINVYWWLIIPSALLLIAFGFGTLSECVDAFSNLTNALFIIFGVLYALSFLLVVFAAPCNAVGSEEFGKTNLVGSTDIVAIKETEYSDIHGMYVRTTPGELYYYDVKTSNGGTYTNCIDGTKFYIEKFEDDKYLVNPHIEEYEYVKSWENWYGFKVEEKITYYNICVPENAIRFYDT